MSDNPKETTAFARIGELCAKYRHNSGTAALARIQHPDGTHTDVTMKDMRDLLSSAFIIGDRMQELRQLHYKKHRICAECDVLHPCDTIRIADGG